MTENNESEELPFCECGCGERVKNLGKKFISGHNARVNHPMKGKVVWNKGQTKETNSSVKRQSEKMTCRTKENNDGMRKMAEKRTGWTKENHEGIRRQSKKMKGRTKDNNVGIKRMSEKLKGRTKENNDSVRRMAETLSGRTKENHPGVKRTSEKMKGRTKETNVGVKIMSEKLAGRSAKTDESIRIGAEKRTGRTKEIHPGVKRMSEKITGELSPTWKGGISFLPYCTKFNTDFKERVRNYFGRCCYLCGKNEADNEQKLSVHHVNYNKLACCEEEIRPLFVPLCMSCHSKVHTNRNDWEELFTTSLDFLTGGECFIHKTEETGGEMIK